tara:strand:- start:850 stop:1773 length:924 start_codon:yes stop_codon:yes gene_type:complete
MSHVTRNDSGAATADNTYIGVHGNKLAASIYGHAKQPVLFFHGGGQTRQAWDATAQAMQRAGRCAITVDLRGHGDSEWLDNQFYSFDDYAADVGTVVQAVAKEYGVKPIAVGASLGGISALVAQYTSGQTLLAALVLVDITPRMQREGVERIIGFMSDRMLDGFGSLEEAAEAVAAYLPNRNRPRSLSGLSKNLRQGKDGRFRWHWDPAFINGPHPLHSGRAHREDYRMDAARALSIPTMLVRGQQSELVSLALAQEFQEMVPQAVLADVSGAGHMVAGDRNDLFQKSIFDFLERIDLTQGFCNKLV